MRSNLQRILLCLLLAVAAVTGSGCDSSNGSSHHRKQKNQSGPLRPEEPQFVVAARTQPIVNLPLPLRYRNPDGSCVHLSWCHILHWQGLNEMAVWWHTNYHHGESLGGIRRKADAAGIRYCDTDRGDVAFVDWACRTGRGAIVFDAWRHCRTLVGLDPAGTPNASAWIMDNNGPREKIIRYGRDEWIQRWRALGGYAATPLYDPTPAPTKL
jgi:hypothetical protein